MFRARVPSLLFSVVILFLLGSSGTGWALIKNCGSLSKLKVVQSSTAQNTSSTSFVTVAGSETSFTQGGTQPGCARISFSAQVIIPTAVMIVRALVDGSPSVDGQIDFVASGVDNFSSHAYNFVFPDLQPGKHNFRMEYLSSNGAQAQIRSFDLAIQSK